MNNKGAIGFGVVVLVILVGLIVGVVGYILLGGGKSSGSAGNLLQKAGESVGIDFSKSSAGKTTKDLHFINSSPDHGEVFVAPPPGVVINFDYTVTGASEITIFNANDKNKTDYGWGVTQIDRSGKALQRSLPQTLPDGTYTVSYKVCGIDNVCNNGQFGYVINSKRKSDYKDLTSQSEVAITINNMEFNPKKIMIRSGTKVTWANEDTPSHSVNSDPYPGQNLYSAMNSEEILTSGIHSYIFNEAGEYPYHCSLHFPSMKGRILVVQ